jgi:hypothetical protein
MKIGFLRRSIELADLWNALGELDARLAAACALPARSDDASKRSRKLPFGPVLVESTRGEDGSVLRSDFWLDGKPRLERRFVDGRLHGRAIAWYRDGRRRWVGQFVRGAQTGEWFYFRRDGKLDGRRTGVYENGLRFAALKGFNDWNA